MDPLKELAQSLRTVSDFPKPGILFQDITPILRDPLRLETAMLALQAPWAHGRVTRVVGIEARGFMLGGALARCLGAGFIPLRKEGKLPFDTFSVTYALEYGSDTMEMHTDALTPADRVLIHDDVLATGGTAAASCELVGRSGAQVVGLSFLLEITSLAGRRRLPSGVPVHAVLAA